MHGRLVFKGVQEELTVSCMQCHQLSVRPYPSLASSTNLGLLVTRMHAFVVHLISAVAPVNTPEGWRCYLRPCQEKTHPNYSFPDSITD
jgi:hypothetical protein